MPLRIAGMADRAGTIHVPTEITFVAITGAITAALTAEVTVIIPALQLTLITMAEPETVVAMTL
jgi:hypothetical protein